MDEGFYMNNSMTNFSDNKDSNNYHAKILCQGHIYPTIIVGPDYYIELVAPVEIKYQLFLMSNY